MATPYSPPHTRGRLHQLGLYQSDRLKLEKVVRADIASVRAMLLVDSEGVEDMFEKLEKNFKKYLAVHTRCQLLLEDGEPDFSDVLDGLDRSIHVLKRQILERTLSNSPKLIKGSSSKEENYLDRNRISNEDQMDSISQTSRRTGSSSSSSSRTSLKDAKLLEIARLKQLKLEQEYLSKRKQAQLDMELLDNEMEIAIAESKLDVFSKAELHGRSKVATDKTYVENYVKNHSVNAEPYYRNSESIQVPHPPSRPKPSFSRASSRYSIPITKTKTIRTGNDLNIPYRPSEHSVKTLNPNATSFSPENRIHSTVINSNNENASATQDKSLLTQMVGYLQAPEAEIDVFRGSPLEYEYFMATFHEAVEKKIEDPMGRLTRLLQYLRGDAKELVKGCIHMPPIEGYTYAKQLLQKRYGDPFRVYSEYTKELQNWPKIKANDGQAFRRFHSFLIKFKSNTDCYRSSRASSPETLQILAKKLPIYLQNRWRKLVLKVRKVGEEAKLSHFIQLVEDESTVVNDPLYSHDALSDSRSQEKNKHPFKVNTSKIPPKTTPPTCMLCKQNHDLDDCPNYKKLSIKGRKEFLFRNRLCFSCYKPTSNTHLSKTCNRKRKCSICKGLHPTGLHNQHKKHDNEIDDKKETEKTTKKESKGDLGQKEADEKLSEVKDSVKSNFQSTAATSIGLCIVPISLFHRDSPEIKIKTYALLDGGSQGTFVDEDILHDLDVVGRDTSLSIKTLHGERKEQCVAVEGLMVSSTHSDESYYPLLLPRTYSQHDLPVDEEDIPTNKRLSKWEYLEPIFKFLPSSANRIKVGLLIGSNCPGALEPLAVIPSENNGPFAYQTRLGWCVSGPIDPLDSNSKKQNNTRNQNGRPTSNHLCSFRSRVDVKDNDLKEMMLTMYQQDFNESPGVVENKRPRNLHLHYSQEDKRFMDMMENESVFENGKYTLPLPFRDAEIHVPNNRIQALQRANYLKRKMLKDENFANDYRTFMSTLIERGYVVKCNEKGKDGMTWYIPHHGVYHPKKPNKIRVVFDCSAKFKDLSLNDMLLQGPDLTNQLVGVLSRFRKEPVGFFGDIEKMFYQVRIPEHQQDFLRILWWPDGNLNSELQEHRMTVHLQGAISSPSCANFALRKTADDNAHKYDEEVSTILKKNFYVDDLLKSTQKENTAQKLMFDTKSMCKEGGFNLVQLGSTSRDIIQQIPEEDRSKGMKNLDLSSSSLPIERVLGVSWCIQNDEFNFRIVLKDKPLTRRGILSSVSSIYDPLGFASPVMLPAKRLLQRLIKDKKGWDEVISSEDRACWEKWRSDLPSLEQVKIPRCFKDKEFGEISKATLHHFSDASTIGYGQCSYLQLVNKKNEISLNFVMGKSRVCPIKPITVPRLELTAAVTSIKVGSLLEQELQYLNLEHVFWTDSKVVLGYINNESKSFHIFVANRIELIRSNSETSQWFHIASEENPADVGSRGVLASKLTSTTWLQGPDFLKVPLVKVENEIFEISPNDPEVKVVKKILVTKPTKLSFIDQLLSITNNWWKLKRIVARMLKWPSRRKKQPVINLDDLQEAETKIIRLVQQDIFSSEIADLKVPDKSKVKSSQLVMLNPFIDDRGILRVGGRLKRSTLNYACKQPIILPKSHRLSKIIVSWYHSKVAHCGRGITMNEVRSAGYWVINLNSLTRSIIRNCFKCRYQRGKSSFQIMADLPADRMENVPPFTYVGVDMFGPYYIKERRSTIKKFVALFTCLNSRAVHFESSSNMDADSFIMMLRRFVARRGQVRLLRSDNGTNFVGCSNELKKAIEEMDEIKIESFILQNGGEWMGWKRNPPVSSHMGGAWERLIRSARSIFSSLLNNHGLSLNNEAFLTVLAEVEAIINSRPLTTDTLSDGNSDLPLSPINLLTMKSKVVMPPPGNFPKANLYSRKRWRRIQHIADEFWCRWRKEYLQSLQPRTKWKQQRRNFRIDDVVLLKESNLRNEWQLGRIINVNTDENGFVRSCLLKTKRGEFVRPIHKLTLLVEAAGEAEETANETAVMNDIRANKAAGEAEETANETAVMNDICANKAAGEAKESANETAE